MGVYTWPFVYTEKSLSMLTATGNETSKDAKEMLQELNASKKELNLKLVFTEMGKDEGKPRKVLDLFSNLFNLFFPS